MLLVIAIVTSSGLLVMSVEPNAAYGQWMLRSQLKDAYKEGYLQSNVTIDGGEIKQK